ncbi:MAG: Ribosome-binding factor A [uncultured bacterium]|nr:MAG: Ribosome-binding factor A [uncultured bacterium]
MSERLKKINSLLKKILSEIINNEIDFAGKTSFFYTVTEVKVTPDLHYADVFISVLGTKEKSDVGYSKLCKRLKQIQHLLATRIQMKFTPKITFKLDSSFDYAFHITEVLNKIKENE